MKEFHYGHWESFGAFKRACPEVGLVKAARMVRLGTLSFQRPRVSPGVDVVTLDSGRHVKTWIPAKREVRLPFGCLKTDN